MAYLLHLDDDPDDIELFKEILSKVDPKMGYEFLLRPYEGLGYLKGAVDLPCVIIVDLNMPIMGGKDFMLAIKEIPHLKEIPLVAFTTSTQPSDREFCLQYCDEFFVKPIDLGGFPFVVQSILSLVAEKVRSLF